MALLILEAIQNMPLLEAFPDETQMMKYKLVTLPRDTAKMPVVTAGGVSVVTLKQTGQTTITPQTLNYLGNNSVQETSGYSFTVSDIRQFATNNGVVGQGITTNAATALNTTSMQTNGTNVSRTVIGTSLLLTATGVNTLYSSESNTNTILYSTLQIIGLDSGARVQIPIQITRT